MKVHELIALLQKLPPNAEVLEERESEVRILREEDIGSSSPTDGDLVTADGENINCPTVIFRAWS